MDQRTSARLSRRLRRKGVKIDEGKQNCRVSRLGFLAGSRGGGVGGEIGRINGQGVLRFIYNIYRS